MAKRGFPRKKSDLMHMVAEIVKKDGRPTPFISGLPGDGFYRGFLKRNQDVVERTAETIHSGRAIVNRESINHWFEGLLSNLQNDEEIGNMELIENPDRIFNCDETNFQLCPKSGKVLGPKGWKNVYQSVKNEKDTVTVLCTFSADGRIVPGMFVYPYVKPPRLLVESVSDGWGVGRSDSGWMRSETFYEYVANVFDPWLLSQQVERPVILFLDGHKSHLSVELSTFCSEKQIILYSLLPNATHILQPADVAIFAPMKKRWRQIVHEWQLANANQSLSRVARLPLSPSERSMNRQRRKPSKMDFDVVVSIH
jgi:hypothetical protein